MGKFLKNIATLLAEKGELNAAQFTREYERRFGAPVLLAPGQKVKDVLSKAEAAGACQLGPNGVVRPASTAAASAVAMPHSAGWVNNGTNGSVIVVNQTSGGTPVVVMQETTHVRGTLAPPRAPMPSPVVIEAVLCFDTTGSMYKYLDAVRKSLETLVGSLVAKAAENSAGLRLGVIAHGDYCDHGDSYVIKYLPLLDVGGAAQAATTALQKVKSFISQVGQTGGGDAPECYELALHKASKDMGWASHSRRLLVMVGDDEPHPPGYKYQGFTNTLDWKIEAASLAEQNVRVYAVQAGNAAKAKKTFWEPLAKMTKGAHLKISQLETIPDLVQAAVCRELGPRAFEAFGAELRARGRMHGETAQVFTTISQTVITVVSGPGGGADTAAAVASALARAALPAPPPPPPASLPLRNTGGDRSGHAGGDGRASSGNRRIFLGQVDYSVKENELRNYIAQKVGVAVGEVTDVAIKKNPNGSSKGAAVVTMASAECARAALARLNGQMLKGRALQLQEAR